jgi:hypothetical protein
VFWRVAVRNDRTSHSDPGPATTSHDQTGSVDEKGRELPGLVDRARTRVDHGPVEVGEQTGLPRFCSGVQAPKGARVLRCEARALSFAVQVTPPTAWFPSLADDDGLELFDVSLGGGVAGEGPGSVLDASDVGLDCDRPVDS